MCWMQANMTLNACQYGYLCTTLFGTNRNNYIIFIINYVTALISQLNYIVHFDRSRYKTSIALNDKLKLKGEINFKTMLPGFVKTGVASHQGPHLDRRDVNLNNPSHSYILHLPLETEGLQLRLGKLDEIWS